MCAGEGVIGSSLGLQTAQQETRCRTGRLQFEKTTGKNGNRTVYGDMLACQTARNSAKLFQYNRK